MKAEKQVITLTKVYSQEMKAKKQVITFTKSSSLAIYFKLHEHNLFYFLFFRDSLFVQLLLLVFL